MSRGPGKVQRFILAELGRRYDPEHPGRWIHANQLTEALAADRGVEVTEALHAAVRRAMRTLGDRGLVEGPAYDRGPGPTRTYFNRHARRVQPLSLAGPDTRGSRCRLVTSDHYKAENEAKIAAFGRTVGPL